MLTKVEPYEDDFEDGATTGWLNWCGLWSASGGVLVNGLWRRKVLGQVNRLHAWIACVALACGCHPEAQAPLEAEAPHIRDVLAWDTNDALVIVNTGEAFELLRCSADGGQKSLFKSDEILTGWVSGSTLHKFMFTAVESKSSTISFYYGDAEGIEDLRKALDLPFFWFPLASFPEEDMVLAQIDVPTPSVLSSVSFVLMPIVRVGGELRTDDPIRLDNASRYPFGGPQGISEIQGIGDGEYFALVNYGQRYLKPKTLQIVSLEPQIEELASVEVDVDTVYSLDWIDETRIILKTRSSDENLPVTFHEIDVDVSVVPPVLAHRQFDLPKSLVAKLKKHRIQNVVLAADWIIVSTEKSGVYVQSLKNHKIMPVPSSTGRKTSMRDMSLKDNVLMVQSGLLTLSFYELSANEVVKIADITVNLERKGIEQPDEDKTGQHHDSTA
jgi:hypothetical protein